MSHVPPPKSVSGPVALRVGLLGCSRIAKDSWTSIYTTGSRVTWLGCRSTARGHDFADTMCQQLGIAKDNQPQVGSYEQLVAASDVDVVYISIPVALRDVWVRECVAHNKHVVDEKPAAAHANVLRGWLSSLSAHHLLFMDGTMISNSKRMGNVLSAVRQLGGSILTIDARFAKNVFSTFEPGEIRADPELEPYGVLGGLGWYGIRYMLHVMNFIMPSKVRGHVNKRNEKGAIIEMNATLTFEYSTADAMDLLNDATEEKGQKETTRHVVETTLFCSFDSPADQTLRVTTTEGFVELDDFVHPRSNDLDEVKWKVVRRRSRNTDNENNEDGEEEEQTYHIQETWATQRDSLWRDVSMALYRELTSKPDEPLRVRPEDAAYWAELSWKTQVVMDQVFEAVR